MWDNRLQMRMIRSEISLDFVFVCTSITMVIMVNIFMRREVLVLLVRCYFVVLLVQLVFRLVSMLSVLKFTPFLFGNWFVMNFWFPYVTTEVEAKGLIFDIISVVIRSMFGRLVMIIGNMIILPWMSRSWLSFLLDSK